MTQRAHASDVFGATLLVAGSCIGAGMLALPIVTGLSGFLPAVIIFIVGWVFMTTTGLLLLEVNLWLGEEVSIISMSGRTLGVFGKVLAWVLFCFLFYFLLVAYTAAFGGLVSEFFSNAFDLALPRWIGSLICTVLFGFLVYFGTRPVDLFNRLFMLGLIATYVLLVGLGARHVQGDLLAHVGWTHAWTPLPVVVIAFGFHNMVPSLTRYLHHNHTRLQMAIIVGSTLVLVINLLWEWLILGIVPVMGPGGFQESLHSGDLATHALRQVVGRSWVAAVAQWFAFFAIVTSFLAQALSLVHFLADGFRISLTRISTAWLTALAVVPPFVAAILDPGIFIRALEMAGAYSAVVLFGIMPALMTWVGRYRRREIRHRLIPGGRGVLVLVMTFASFVIVVEVLHQFGVLA